VVGGGHPESDVGIRWAGMLVIGDWGAGEDALPGAAVHAHVQVIPRHPRLRIHSPPRDGERAADDSRRRTHPHLRRRRVTPDGEGVAAMFIG